MPDVRRPVAFITALLVLSGSTACVGATDSPTATGAAYTTRYEALGRPAALHLESDSAAIVTRMMTSPMRGMNREVAARAAARTVAGNRPVGRLASVVVVFRDATRLGPFRGRFTTGYRAVAVAARRRCGHPW